VYTFFRSVRLGPGSVQEQMAWSVSMTEKVNQISETTFTLWTPFMSPGINRLIWLTFVDDLATLEATGDKLMTDSGYHMLLEQAVRYSSGDPIDDGLLNVVHNNGFDPSKPPAYIAEIEALARPGAGTRAMEVGIELAQRGQQISGAPSTFSVGATGRYGYCAWHSGFTSITELQRANEKVNTDAKFAELVDKSVKDVFEQGAQNIYRRLA